MSAQRLPMCVCGVESPGRIVDGACGPLPDPFDASAPPRMVAGCRPARAAALALAELKVTPWSGGESPACGAGGCEDVDACFKATGCKHYVAGEVLPVARFTTMRQLEQAQRTLRVVVTAHRPQTLACGFDPRHPLRLRIEAEIRAALRDALAEAAATSPGGVEVITGLALGGDQWVAQAAIELGIPFAAYVPCPEQDAKWSPEQSAEWLRLLAHAHRIVVTAARYSPGAMMGRNRAMLDDCRGPRDRLLAIYDGRETGGTFSCYASARKGGLRVVRIDPRPEASPQGPRARAAVDALRGSLDARSIERLILGCKGELDAVLAGADDGSMSPALRGKVESYRDDLVALWDLLGRLGRPR